MAWLGLPDVASTPWDAAAAVRDGYDTNSYVWRAINVVADAVASLPFLVDDRRSRLLQLLGPPPDGPNPAMAAHQLWHHAVCSWMVTGRFGWEIETGRDGSIVGLWPLPAVQIDPKPSSGGTSYWEGFRVGRGSTAVDLRSDQVLYHWRPRLDDFRRAESPLIAARLPVSLANMQARYDHAFLANDARPSAIVITERMGTAEEHDEWAQTFVNQHLGPARSGRMAFLETSSPRARDAIHVETMGIDQQAANFEGREKAQIQAICVALGVPLSVMGDASARTYENAQEDRRIFWQGTVLPVLRELEGAVNMGLAPRMASPPGRFDLTSVDVLDDRRPKLDAPIADLVAAGIMTLEEARNFYGLGPLAEPPTPAVVVQPVVPALSAESDDHRSRLARVALARVGERIETAVRSRWEGKRGRQARAAGDMEVLVAAVWSEPYWRGEITKVLDDLDRVGAPAPEGMVEDVLAQAERAIRSFLAGGELQVALGELDEPMMTLDAARLVLTGAQTGGT